MAIKLTDACNGCAECIGCGRKAKYRAVFCDVCGEETGSRVYLVDGKQLCDTCALEVIESVRAEDLCDD